MFLLVSMCLTKIFGTDAADFKVLSELVDFETILEFAAGRIVRGSPFYEAQGQCLISGISILETVVSHSITEGETVVAASVSGRLHTSIGKCTVLWLCLLPANG